MNAASIAREAIERGAIQKPGEFVGLIALLMERPPKVVVEIGCDAGGSLWAWSQLGAELVIGVDMPGGPYSSGNGLHSYGATIVYGDSHAEFTKLELTRALGGRSIDFLFIDGDHTYEGVKSDFEMYSPLVALDGIIGFHDINEHLYVPGVGVKQLWDELTGNKEEFHTGDPYWGGIGVLYRTVVSA